MGTSIPGQGRLQAVGGKRTKLWIGGLRSGVGWGEYRYENLALSLDFSCLRELKPNSKVGYW